MAKTFLTDFFSVLFFVLFAIAAQASILSGELAAPSSLHSLLNEEHPITVELGLEYLHPSLPNINNVVVENTRTSTVASAQRGNVDNSTYPDVFAQTMKIQAMVDAEKRWTVAMKTYLPLNSMMEMDTGNIYQPEYVLYRAEAQRPRILLTSGMNLNEDWRVGLGADIGFSVKSQANVFLQGGAGTVSDQRISAKVKPSIVPQASIGYRNYTFAVRGENKAEFELNTSAAARVFGGTNAAPNFAYQTQSALYYQPWEFELSGKNGLSDAMNVKWGLSYQLWSRYQARAALIQPDSCGTSGACSNTYSGSQAPAFSARNLLVPEAGLEFLVGDHRYDIGYRYKDSIFADVPKTTGNYLDPPRHDLLLGATFMTQKGWEWSLKAQVSRLVSQEVNKADPNEIGAGGYTASGWLYGGGLSVAIPFKN